MNITYLKKKSKFLDKINDIIIQKKSDLMNGRQISVKLSPQGYNGNIIVVIDKNNTEYFKTDWNQEDETRFPARIKAASHALLNQKCYGKYRVTHNTGKLTIQLL